MSKCKFISAVIAVFMICSFAGAEQQSLESQVQSAISKVLPSTVVVSGGSSLSGGFGSGFVLDNEKGYVVTNYHVIVGSKNPSVGTKDKKKIKAEVVYHDSKFDLALLKVEKPADLPPALPLAKQPVKLGQFIVAAGSPGGYDHSVTLGIVSAVDRTLNDQNSEVKFLQVDAPMFRGSSGGPLVNLSGAVIGVNSRGGANGAAAFAVPSENIQNLVKRYEDELANKAKAKDEPKGFGYLGAVLQAVTPGFQKYFKLPEQKGALVAYVYPNSGAAKSGIKSGDIILSIGEMKLNVLQQGELELTKNHLMGLAAGNREAVIWRDGKKKKLSVQMLGEPPCDDKSIEHDRISLVSRSENSCYLLPEGEFLEFSRYWKSSELKTGEQPKAGDLIVSIKGSSSNLSEQFHKLVDTKKMFQAGIIRNGRPKVVLIGSVK